MKNNEAWNQFRQTGLFVFVNSFLHIFGWAIVLEVKNNVVLSVYPQRVNYRGFDQEIMDEAYVKISKHLKETQVFVSEDTKSDVIEQINIDEERFFLCSKAVIEHFSEVSKSIPFKSGYEYDNDEDYYIAALDFDIVSDYYTRVIEPFNDRSRVPDIDFWCRECVPGTMNVSKITIAGMKRRGLFAEIQNKLDLTNEKNRAMAIYNLADKYNCTPIELINKIESYKL